MYREKHKTNTTIKNDIIRIGRYRLRTIHVHYFTWFQKTYGNPYFAMIVTVNQGYPSEQTFYAYFLLDSYIDICKWCADQNEAIPDLSLDLVLNGASGWHQYSYGGCALVYDGDIAKVVFTAVQFTKWQQGRKVTDEPMLDIQARALAAGWRVLKSAQRYADMCANLQNRQPNEK